MKPISEAIFWITCFLYIAAPIETARILAIIPLPFYSHQVSLRLIWTALSQKGHEIVLLTTDPINDPSLTNLTEINFDVHYKFKKDLNLINELETQKWLEVIRTQFWPLSSVITENIFKHPKVCEMYVPNSDKKIDLIIAETLFTPGTYVLAHRFNAPLIGITTLGLSSTDYYLNGAPVLPSHSSNWEIVDKNIDFKFTFWQRIKNFIYQWHHIYCTLNYFYPEQQAIAEKYLGKNIPDIRDMERNMSFIFQNQQEVISNVRPQTSNVLSFGNFHILKKPADLPKNLKEFIEDAPNGFIYMSLGTNVQTSWLSKNTHSIFRDVLASLPYKVIWKHELYENGEFPNQPDNIYIAKWFSQQSILAHPKIRLFIYQGGLQSTEEAVHYAVPLLGIPIVGDQFIQVNKMVSLGVAKHLSLLNISRENLNASIMDIVSDKSYRQALKMAKRMKSSAHLENITSIPMECSDVENDELYDSEGELLDNQSNPHGSNHKNVIIESSDSEISDKDNGDESSDSQYENISNIRTRRYMRDDKKILLSSSEDEDESEIQDQQTEIAADGTIWKKIEEGGVAGRLPVQSIFKDVPGPTAHAKRNIMKGELSSTFLLLIDHHILEHVRTCTELEVSRVLGKKWILTQAKLKAFIAILYARIILNLQTKER